MPEEIEVGVDPQTCTSAQMCTMFAPDTFQYDDDLMASRAVRSPVEASDEVWQAIESCPVEAIWARNPETGEQLYP